MSSTQKPSTSLLREMKNHQAYASTNVRKNLDTTTCIRFPLEIAVAFGWEDDSGAKRHGEGRSRDISECGVFVFANNCPPVGTKVQLRMLLEEPSDTARPLHIQIEGHVLRVEQSEPDRERMGFAIMSDETILRDSDQVSE